MRTSTHFTSSNDDVTIRFAIDAGRAWCASGVAGRQHTAALT